MGIWRWWSSTTPPPTEQSIFLNNLRIAAVSYYNDENLGFAAAQNQAIGLSQGEWVLTLNPDVLLLPNFIQSLVEAGQVDSKVGAVCGKLLTIRPSFDLPEKELVDSTGIYFTPMLHAIWIAEARKSTTATT